MRSIGIGRALFAITLASIAILSLSYGDFVPRGQPFPAWIPVRETWIYGSAILILAVSVGLCFPRTAQPALLTLGAYQALWTLICALPLVSTPLDIGSWYGFCEALTPLISGGILYVMLRGQPREPALRLARALFGLTCVFYGWSHFYYADYTAGMVPAWLPARSGLAYFTGLAHMAAGIGLTIGVLPRLAATLEAIMMSLFGLLVWVPSFFMHPKPDWATPTQNEWSELVVTLVLATCAWLVAISLQNRQWGLDSRTHLQK
ncbi:MAG: DoxX family protein [Steroidobacteraceae bacterium]